MFTRTKTFKNKDGSTRTYLQIVETKRDGNKVRQKVVANLGRLEELQQEGTLDKLIEGLARYSFHEWVKLNAVNMQTRTAKEWGPALIYHHLWKQLGLESILNELMENTNAVSDYTQAAFAMALNRLCDPRSKRGVDKWVQKVYWPSLEQLQVHHYYRALDYLAENKAKIEKRLFDKARDIFNVKLDLVFWDTTTTYFEGSGPEMAAKGYSKDRRPDRSQVVIGVLMTKDGYPVAHQAFPGNTADIDTFKSCIRDLKDRFCIDKVILVADRGMVSPKLLKEVEEENLSYIIGVKMRQLKSMADVLGRAGRYRKVTDNLKVKEVVHQEERYIVCLNPQEAEKDQHAREEMVSK